MKQLLMTALLIIVIAQICFTQDSEPNVLSYYAVGNSLDGQPMVGMPNVLRFFPVYAMREQLDSVRVTVYYGGKIFSRCADPLEEKAYWEVMLPEFKLGEAIQRLEVEVRIHLGEKVLNRFPEISFLKAQVKVQLDSLETKRKSLQNDIPVLSEDFDANKKREFAGEMKRSNEQFKTLGINPRDADRLRKNYGYYEAYTHMRDSLIYISPTSKTTPELIDALTRMRYEILSRYTGQFEEYRDRRKAILQSIDSLERNKGESEKNLVSVNDSIRVIITEEIETQLTDTMYSGPSVRKSDVVIDDDCENAHIFYRNYKSALRHLLTLDAAERMGIFRVRYVPFPIVGTVNNPRPTLMRPLNASSQTVFEVGLAFGDAIVPGDDFIVPEFSWRRLGIAFAITEKLFNDDADIVGLVLTYDFNSYGSLGVGGNFAHNETHGYASLGINKKAFEAVVKGLAGLFK